jgi:plastocyanin
MRFRYLSPILCLLPLAAVAVAMAKNHVIDQREKAFSKTAISAKVGDTLTFHNGDPFVHSIFSLSDVQPFDLGALKAGDTRQVVLSKPGRMVVECAVHPQMKLVVEIGR